MEDPQGAVVAAQFSEACSNFDIKDKAKLRSLIATLEFAAQTLAHSEVVRIDAGANPQLWSDLRRLWRDVTRTQFSFWENDDSDDEDEKSEEDGQGDFLRAMCSSLAKFTRNLVAGVPGNQSRAFENEPDIRRLLHFYTSWSAMEDSESVATARVLTQALSNTVTANDVLVAKLWGNYMNLPEDQVVFIRLILEQDSRLLGSPDSRTLLTTLIFILNCIHGSRKRAQLLVKTKVGVRMCIGLLDNMIKLHDVEEGSEGAKAFDIGYAIFTQIIEGGMVPDLYRKFTISNEIVTPHQTTLLKLVDSYLQSTQLEPPSIEIPDILKTHMSLGSFLAKRFFTLSEYAQRAMHRSLGMVQPEKRRDIPSSGSSAEDTDYMSERPSFDSVRSVGSSSSSPRAPTSIPKELDVMLPRVCEALVLVTQCIITVCLEAEEQQTRLEEGVSTFTDFTNMKGYYIQKKHDGHGIVESLIDVLGLLDIFLPRIQFGKPVNSDGTPMSPTESPSADVSGFSYVKRDLIRLLGVLSHGSQAVQDRTREAGGLPIVMNMCVIDERNPYLREHAIFTLHNLLKNNPDNQGFVDSVKPSQEWGKDGTLKTKVGATLR